jgi:2-polyprenyl-6-methoxyphenol hydroxylase-like FAD-dependent oxidoreductase
VFRERRQGGGMGFADGHGGYAAIDGNGFASADGLCRLTVGADGRVEIVRRKTAPSPCQNPPGKRAGFNPPLLK